MNDLESHPWEPYIPQNARILIMGTFPPPSKRWAMDFYYPNRTNDFWHMMGLIFRNDRTAFYDNSEKKFRLNEIKQMLNEYGIALNDTGLKVRRLKGNASDKYLEIVEPVHLADLLQNMPACHTLATTGEKAAGVVAEITGTSIPAIGKMSSCEFCGRNIDIYRMPSTSRAYPLALEKKAAFYAEMFRAAGILS